MSLVERAVEELRENRVVRRQSSPQKVELSQEKAENLPGNSFSLDEAWLQQQGLFVPSKKPERLPQELRAIKRRLLRRLKFYKKGRSGTTSSVRVNTRQKRKVLITSTSPAEGKTFTAINLALSLSLEDNLNVLLVDADIPRPRVLKYLNIPPAPGLADRVAAPDLNLENLILTETAKPFSILPSGDVKTVSGDIFSDPQMSAAMREIPHLNPDGLVIFDAPPVLAAPEAVLLAQHVDEVVFVIKANTTPEPAVVAALEEIMEHNENVSVVLNHCFVPGKFAHYGSYGEYYYKSGNEDE